MVQHPVAFGILPGYNHCTTYRRAAIVGLFLLAVLRAAPQATPPGPAAEPIILKSASHAVQVDVVVNDPSGHPVHGLQKNDFVVTDNGHPRDIRIFAGEIDANQSAPSIATTVAPAMYSNRLSLRDSPIVTAIVIDAVPRPEGLPENGGRLTEASSSWWSALVRMQALDAISKMQPGEIIAIYAACPELRIVQEYTSDPGRLDASLRAFVPPSLPGTAGKKQQGTVDALVPPMLSALRKVTAGMAGASGRKSVVWIS
jgi:VWFA-related protein